MEKLEPTPIVCTLWWIGGRNGAGMGLEWGRRTKPTVFCRGRRGGGGGGDGGSGRGQAEA